MIGTALAGKRMRRAVKSVASKALKGSKVPGKGPGLKGRVTIGVPKQRLGPGIRKLPAKPITRVGKPVSRGSVIGGAAKKVLRATGTVPARSRPVAKRSAPSRPGTARRTQSRPSRRGRR